MGVGSKTMTVLAKAAAILPVSVEAATAERASSSLAQTPAKICTREKPEERITTLQPAA